MRIIIFFALIIISFLPILLLGYYIYEKDTIKEPKKLLIKLFFSGFIISLLVIVINVIFAIHFRNLFLFNNSYKDDFVLTFSLAFIEIGFLEEFIKWFVIKKTGYNSPEFDQIYDIIVYCTFVSLGFAFFENIFYVLNGGIKIGILRGLLSVPAHACYGVFMGYFLGKAKINKGIDTILYFILSILIPSFLHTLYDTILMFDGKLYFWILITYMTLLYIISFKIINNYSKGKI